jgi:hypothetical protein
MNNTRNNVLINGYTFSELAEKIGLGRSVLRSRYYRGMSIDKILKDKLYRPAKL